MASTQKQISVIYFEIQGSWFAVPLENVEGVASIPEIVAVPGNASRVFVGVAYILGQIMSVVDCAPLFNLGNSDRKSQCLIVQLDKEYYGIMVHHVGKIVSDPPLKKIAQPETGIAQTSFEHNDKKIILLDIHELIGRHVCN